MNRFFIFLLAMTMFVYVHGFSNCPDTLVVQNRNVYFVLLTKKWGGNKFKNSYLICFDNNLYSGDYWQGYNLACISFEDTIIDKEISKRYNLDQIFSLADSVNKMPFKHFETSNKYLDNNYMWKCIKVDLHFVKLHCNVENRYINNEIFFHPNGITPLLYEPESIVFCNVLPKYIVDKFELYVK